MEDFKHNTLGVMTAATDLTTALVSGVHGGLFDGLVHQPLNYPYPNYDDALAPQPDAQTGAGRAIMAGRSRWRTTWGSARRCSWRLALRDCQRPHSRKRWIARSAIYRAWAARA